MPWQNCAKQFLLGPRSLLVTKFAFPVTMTSTAEQARLRNNERAWRDLSGYQTSSGCPLWDRTRNVCIPKGSFGIGYTINCWALCCCFLCEKPLDSTYRPTKRVWMFAVVIVAGVLVMATGVAFATTLSQHCQGFHGSGTYYNYDCVTNSSHMCCTHACGISDNTCESLQDLGGGTVLAVGIALAFLGLVMTVSAVVAWAANRRALRLEHLATVQQPQQREGTKYGTTTGADCTGSALLLPDQEEPNKI
jgi:hypothetical protein